jgi:hypothetical protein
MRSIPTRSAGAGSASRSRGPGVTTVTLAGDSKQSIYRFRRADIAVSDRVRSIVVRAEHLAGSDHS